MGLTNTITRRVGGRALDRAIDDLADRLAPATRRGIDLVVRTRGASTAADADIFRLQHPELSGAALERAYVRARGRRAGAGGLASGLPSVVPAAGTAVEVAAGILDAAQVTYAQVALVLGLCHLRGRDIGAVEARRLDVLLALGIDAEVVTIEKGELRLDGTALDLNEIATMGLPDEALARLNRELGERVVSTVAKRRARALAGRLVPLGVGVAVAGVNDLRWVQSAGKATMRYLDLIESARPARDPATPTR